MTPVRRKRGEKGVTILYWVSVKISGGIFVGFKPNTCGALVVELGMACHLIPYIVVCVRAESKAVGLSFSSWSSVRFKQLETTSQLHTLTIPGILKLHSVYPHLLILGLLRKHNVFSMS